MRKQKTTPSILFTIGHSNHTLAHFTSLLQLHRITALGDVRSHPVSRFVKHFNKKNLEKSLPRAGVSYLFFGNQLGARTDDESCYLDGRVSYERLAERSSFKEGLQRVLDEAKQGRLALMCAEKEPLTCHRMILICRHLRSSGLAIRHIHANGSLESNEAAEKRLLKTLKLAPDLFISEDEIIERAYERQGKRIAYSKKD